MRVEEITIIAAPVDRCFDLSRSVEVHLLGNRHWRENAAAVAGATSGLLEFNDCVTWRARHFGVRWLLTSRITAFNRPTFFEDRQIGGPFRAMDHQHHFREIGDGRTEMRDVFSFAAPIPILGRAAEILLLGRYMRALLRERNRAIRQIAESADWRSFPGL